jgi:hypothetical protein
VSRRGDPGSATVELVWLALLLLVPLIWLVISVFDVQRGSFGVAAAARAAGRAFALAPDDASGRQRAELVARQALADQGLGDAPLRLSVTCTPYPSNCHDGTSVITVHVRTSVVLRMLPDVLGSGQPTFALFATQTVPIGRYVQIDRPR